MSATRRCRWCGHPIELWTEFRRWMHVTTGEAHPSTEDGTAWWHCERTIAEPVTYGGVEGRPRWRIEPEERGRLMVDGRGRQIIEVLGKYGYVWGGVHPLKVGEWVLLPSNAMHTSPWKAKITGLGSTWTGRFESVLAGRLSDPEEE